MTVQDHSERAASAPRSTLPASPYPGLESFTEQDAAFFFGREAEARIITANLLSARLTLLFGPSGVGKSSVLRASVVRNLRRRGAASLDDGDTPGVAVVIVSEWRDDPLATITLACRNSVCDLLGRHDLSDPDPDATLSEVLEYWAEQIHGRVLVIFDQFEEYFLYHQNEHGDATLDDQFPDAVASPSLRANFLLSVRDDALARLERFKGRVPRLFENRLQIERLTVTAAREAIVEPVNEYNRRAAPADKVGIEDDFVADLLADLHVLAPNRAGAGMLAAGRSESASSPTENDARVEAPILQIVLTAVWRRESERGSHTLQAATLHELGGVQAIVRDRLQRRMEPLDDADQDVAAAIFQFLVTPSEAKIAWSAAELAQFSELPEARIAPVLDRLSAGDARILRPVPAPGDEGSPRYEIFHDVLAQPVREWRIAHAARREGRELARRRLVGFLQVLGSVAVAIIVVVAIVAWWQRNDAQHQRNIATAQAREAQNQEQIARAEKRRTDVAKEKLANAVGKLKVANASLHRADSSNRAIVGGLLLVRSIKDTVGRKTGLQLRVLDFQFSRGRKTRPVAYQIQFEPSVSDSVFFEQAKIWVWPSDQVGAASGYVRPGGGQYVTYQWQLTHGAAESHGVYWRPQEGGCVGGKRYDVRRDGAIRARINFLWFSDTCGVAPSGWAPVDAALEEIAKG